MRQDDEAYKQSSFGLVETFISENFKDVEIFVDSKWASTYSEHRKNIRRHLYKKTKDKSVLDLNFYPKLKEKFVSISHCPVMGGFVLSQNPIGFDVEQAQRLSLRLIQRISSTNELKLFSDEHYKCLWTIKESVLKHIKKDNALISQVEVLKVKTVKDLHSIKIFEVASQLDHQNFLTYSFVIQNEDVIMSITKKSSSEPRVRQAKRAGGCE